MKNDTDHSTLAFEPLMKLPAIVADAGIPLMLAHWTGGHVRPMTAQRAALAYACNPLSTLVVAVHGQFDSLPTLFLLLGAFRLRKGVTTSAQAAGAGAFFGLAILAKTWPIMVAPLAVLHVSGWLRRGVFVASVVTVPTIGVLLYCVISGAGPLPLLHRVLNYSSVEGVWGYPLILKELHRICGYDWAWTVYEWTAARARLILGFGLAGATLAAARHPIEQGCTLVLLAFCVLTPGWGTHYAVWGLPFVLLSASTPLAASFVLTAGAISSVFFLGFGGVYFEALRFVDLNSPLWTYVADISLPLWILCGVVFGSIWRLKAWRRVPVA